MSGVAEFLHMGGYAQFVWPAYAIALVVLTALPAAASEELVVESVDLTDMPEVSLVVTLPPTMAGSEGSVGVQLQNSSGKHERVRDRL